MSSEVCPFCGKTYKRLKTHLPHCKAAAIPKTPPTKHDVTANQTSSSSSSQLAAAMSESTAKSAQTLSITASPQSKKSKKVSVVSSSGTPSSSPSSASPLPTAKKKKQKLSEQIKAANVPSSTVFLPSSPSLSLSSTVSKPKRQSLRSLIEAAKSTQVSKGSQEGTTSVSEVQTLSSRPTAKTKTSTSQDTIKDNAHPASLSADTKPKTASKTKASKTKKAAQTPPTTKHTSTSLDSEANKSSARSGVREDSRINDEGEVEDLSVNKMLLKSGSSHQARVTIQDVKAMLGRSNATRKSSRPSILSQIETADDLNNKIRLGTGLSPVPPPAGSLETSRTPSDQLPSTSLQPTKLQLVKRKSKPASLVPVQQLELTSPAAPLLSGGLSSQVSKATPPPHTVSVNEGLKVTGLLTVSPSLTKFSSPLPVVREETLRADDGLKSQLEGRKQKTADEGSKGALTQRRLGQVRLRELPEWLACKTPSHPRDVVEMVQRGWQWYYRRYIDVKKGGVGGVGMLLAGYCVLSYIWRYPHLKHDRWRKYH